MAEERATCTAVPCARRASRHSAYDSQFHGIPAATRSTGMSSMKPNTSLAATRSAAACTGVSDSEQLPVTTVVTPRARRHRVDQRVPPHRRVVVRVAVDEPGRDVRTVGIDDRLAVGCEPRRDLGDRAVADADVRGARRCARPVDQRAAPDQQVPPHGGGRYPVASESSAARSRRPRSRARARANVGASTNRRSRSAASICQAVTGVRASTRQR